MGLIFSGLQRAWPKDGEPAKCSLFSVEPCEMTSPFHVLPGIRCEVLIEGRKADFGVREVDCPICSYAVALLTNAFCFPCTV